MKVINSILLLIAIIIASVIMFTSMRHNDDQNWQVVQSVSGQVTIRDTPGWYMKPLSKVWTWPRAISKPYSKIDERDSRGDESFRVTFNDGGNADMSTFFRVQTPITEDTRRKAHRDFNGNPENMLEMVRKHMISAAKATAPLMSSSENQSARKAEFQQLIEEQMNNGIYEMRKVSKVLKDQFDEKGNSVTVFATEIVTDENGKPKIATPSPLNEYGMRVMQFSVTATDYDDQTIKQFEAKKQSFLQAEQSKAQREQEVQLRLMTIEKGLREKAEIEAKANVEKAQATITAQKEKEVAETKANQEKVVAETTAAKLVAVALLEKQEAETRAQKELEVAKLAKAAAEENAAAIMTLAKAQEEKIKLGGAITERERTLAEIRAQRDVGVAEKLAQIQSPKMIMSGAGEGGSGNSLDSLISLRLLQATGVLDENRMPEAPTNAPR